MSVKSNKKVKSVIWSVAFALATLLILVLTYVCSHYLPQIYHMPLIEHGKIDMNGREDWVVLPGEWEYYYEKWIITDNLQNAEPDGFLSMPDVWTGKTTNSGQKLPRTGYGSFRLMVENVKPGLEILVFANNYDGAYRTYINGVLNVEYGVMSKDVNGTKSNGRAENMYPYKVSEGEVLDVVVEISNNNEGGMHYAFYLRSDFKTNQIMIGDQLAFVVLGLMLALLLLNIIANIIYKEQQGRSWSLTVLLLFIVLMYIFSVDILMNFSLSTNALLYNCIAEVFYAFSIVTIVLFCVHLNKNGIMKVPKKWEIALISLINVGCIAAFYSLSGYKERIIPPIIQIVCMMQLYYPVFKSVYDGVRFAKVYIVVLFGLTVIVVSQMLDMLEAIIIGTESVAALAMVLIMFAIFTMHFIKIADKNKAALQTESYKRKLAEISNNMLKAQIKPHFVFNSLASIQAVYHASLDKGDEAISEFASHLRTLVDADHKTSVGLDEEVNNVINYVRLVELSKGNCINLLLDIGNYDVKVPVLSLQPFVENAIKYSGIVDDPDGYVLIKADDDGDDNVIITIEDNGCGFDLNEVKPTSVGLRNARERICFITGFEVAVDTKPGCGTKVTITVPKEDKNEYSGR